MNVGHFISTNTVCVLYVTHTIDLNLRTTQTAVVLCCKNHIDCLIRYRICIFDHGQRPRKKQEDGEIVKKAVDELKKKAISIRQ